MDEERRVQKGRLQKQRGAIRIFVHALAWHFDIHAHDTFFSSARAQVTGLEASLGEGVRKLTEEELYTFFDNAPVGDEP